MGFNYSSLIRLEHLAKCITGKHRAYFARWGPPAPGTDRPRGRGGCAQRETLKIACAAPPAAAARKPGCSRRKLRVCFVCFVFQRSSRCCKMPLGLPPLPLPLAAPSVPAAEGLGRDTLVPAACPGQEPGLGPEEGIKYASNICSGALNNQPSPVRGDLQGPPPKPCPRGGRGMEGDVCPSCGRSSWRRPGALLPSVLPSPA